MKYKVIKTQDVFEKGDVFVRNEDGTYSCKVKEESNGYTYTSNITVSEAYINSAVKDGILVSVDHTSKKNTSSKYEEVIGKLTDLQNKYQEDIENTQNKYKLGKISRVEESVDVTVLSNLSKLAGTIIDMLKEDK